LTRGVNDEPLALDVYSTRDRGGLVQVHGYSLFLPSS
jgi:hypothetical protein